MTSKHNATGAYVCCRGMNRSRILTCLAALAVVPLHLAAQQPPPSAGQGGQRQEKAHAKVDHPKFKKPDKPTKVLHKPHLPTMDATLYANLKVSAQSGSGTKPGAASGVPVPLALNISFPGLDRFGSADLGFVYTPPDVNTAVGLGQIAEVTNNAYAVYDTLGNQLQSIPMSVFFGYSTQGLFDPRVVYDSVWNRWIVIETAFPENPTTQYFFFAVSQTADATGAYYVYQFNMPLAANDFYDYPQVGYDQDALIFTFNVFNGQPFKYAEIDVAPKARVYNGLGFSMLYQNGFPGTLTPNIVRDNNGITSVIRNAPGTNFVQLFRITNSSRNTFAVAGPFNVTTSPYNVPPQARQPGTTARLDTLDTRFQAPGTQVGSSLYQAHTVNLSSFPAPRVLQLNIATNTEVREDIIFASGTSDDWNPSIAGNDNGDVFVNWSSADAPAGLNAGAVYATKPSGTSFGPVGLCFRSGTFYTDFRWGDTSGASLDPSDPTQKTFWGSNETIQSSTNWGTQVCSVGL